MNDATITANTRRKLSENVIFLTHTLSPPIFYRNFHTNVCKKSIFESLAISSSLWNWTTEERSIFFDSDRPILCMMQWRCKLHVSFVFSNIPTYFKRKSSILHIMSSRSKHLLFVLSIFLSSSWGFCILLMDSAYNYDAKNDAKVSIQQLLPLTTKSMICPSFNFVEQQ